VAEKVLLDAARLGRETRGELDRFTAPGSPNSARGGRGSSGKDLWWWHCEVATQRGHVDKAIDHFSDAWQ
ncbi:unnamed protein product, partial [Durusdinium trenchii]